MKVIKVIKNIVSPSYWIVNKQSFREFYEYDLRFNASFRGKKQLTAEEMSLPQIKYLKLYRIAQACRGTIWYKSAYNRLLSYGRRTGIGLHDNMNIPKGLIIGHAGTIVINADATFDGNLFLTHGVTIGRDIRGTRCGAPHFGKDVVIRCNSTVVGKINIGDDVLIAPNTFVNFDVPSHSIVIGNPATVHHRDHATEGHIGIVKEHIR